MASFPVFQETEGEWTSVRTVEILGVRIPAYFTTDPQLLYNFITNFQTNPDDVFIGSYPKSGKLLEKTIPLLKRGGELKLYGIQLNDPDLVMRFKK